MPALILFILTASLFDGLSTIQQAVILILLLSTDKPVKNPLGYLLGIFTAYLACGIIGLQFASKLSTLIYTIFPQLARISDPLYYQSQLFTGIILFISGPLFLVWKKMKKNKNKENGMVLKLKRINPVITFLMGAFISSTSFPAAVPYIAAIEKIGTSGFSLAIQYGLVLLYNLVYILPTLVPFVIYLILRGSIEGIENKLHIHVNRWNVILTVVLLSGTALLLIIDSAVFYMTGHPFLKNKFF